MATLVFTILIVSTLPLPLNIVQPAQAGKFGDIVPTSEELELLAKINENRTGNGAGVLKLNSSLVWVARAHSQDMIDFDWNTHPSPPGSQFGEGTMPKERANDHAGYTNTYIGEIIYTNTAGINVEGAMSAWMASQDHKDIILDPAFHEVGIGLLEGEWSGWPSCGLHTVVFGGGSVSVDLTVSSGDITFDPSSPNEGQLVDISAVIHNNGATDAYPVVVEFYDGDPDSGGIQIGLEQQVPHILVQGESATVNVTWDTTGEGDNHDIYVVVDGNNIISETNEANNKAFRTLVVNGPFPPIHLEEGWNLVSFPHIVSNTNLEDVLTSINTEYDTVWSFNSSDIMDSWKHYHTSKPSNMNDLSDLDNKIGFWIHVTDADGAELVVDGDLPTSPQSISLKAGWNLVGYPSTSSRLRNESLNNLDFGTHISVIRYYDTTTDTLKDVGINDYMGPGKGYWMLATQDCTWIVNN